MERLVVIPVDELTPATFTRARGAEAFDALMQRINSLRDGPTTLLIDVSQARLVSGSFLDELVRNLSSRASHARPQIGFRLGPKERVAKLERVCSIRQVECIYQSEGSEELKKTRIRRKSRFQVRNYPGSFFEPGSP